MRISDWSSDVCSADLIMRPRAGLGVPLEAERGGVAEFDALQRTVEQRAMGGADVAGKARFVHGKTVILTGYHHPPGLQIGRESCTERGCHAVYIPVVYLQLKQKKRERTED